IWSRSPGGGSKVRSRTAARVRSARRHVSASRRGLRRRGPQPRPPRLDRPEALRQAGPSPGLDLVVAGLRLALRRLEVLEPRIRLLDHQELFGLAPHRHGFTSDREWPDRRTRLGRTPSGAVATLKS